MLTKASVSRIKTFSPSKFGPATGVQISNSMENHSEIIGHPGWQRSLSSNNRGNQKILFLVKNLGRTSKWLGWAGFRATRSKFNWDSNSPRTGTLRSRHIFACACTCTQLFDCFQKVGSLPSTCDYILQWLSDCNTLHHPATHCIPRVQQQPLQHSRIHGITLQYTATHCNTLHTFLELNGTHTAIVAHCNTLQQHTATRCNILQHTAIHYTNTPQHTASTATHYSTQQHTATHRNTPRQLQRRVFATRERLDFFSI